MSATPCKATAVRGRHNRTLLRDLMAWNRETGEDNSERLERLRQNLRRARRDELTPRQAQFVHMYFDLEMSVTAIAEKEGIHKSSVSRTLKRARERLKNYLKYSL